MDWNGNIVRIANRYDLKTLNQSMSEYVKLSQVPSDYISDLCVISEENRLIVSSWDGTLSLYDLIQGRLLLRLKHEFPITCCHTTKDGKIWAGSVQGELLEADWESEKLLLRNSVLVSLGISSLVSFDQCLVISSWDGSLIVLDHIKDKVVKEWRFNEKIFQMCASEHKIICSLSGGKIKILDIPGLAIEDRDSGLKYQCRSSTLIPNNRGFVQGSIDGRVSVEFFDDESQKFAFRCHRMNLEDVQLVFPVTALTFQPNSLNLFTGGSDGKVVSWNLNTRKKQEELPKLDDTIVKMQCTEEYLVIATSDDSFKTCATPQDIKLNSSSVYIKHL